MQDVIVVAAVLIAVAFLVRRLTGWPPAKKKPAPVQLGDRLASGLKRAQKKR